LHFLFAIFFFFFFDGSFVDPLPRLSKKIYAPRKTSENVHNTINAYEYVGKIRRKIWIILMMLLYRHLFNLN